MSSSGTVTRGNHTATYEVRGGMVTIEAGLLGQKSAGLGRLPALVLAGLLLQELIVEDKRRERSAMPSHLETANKVRFPAKAECQLTTQSGH